MKEKENLDIDLIIELTNNKSIIWGYNFLTGKYNCCLEGLKISIYRYLGYAEFSIDSVPIYPSYQFDSLLSAVENQVLKKQKLIHRINRFLSTLRKREQK